MEQSEARLEVRRISGSSTGGNVVFDATSTQVITL
jgi:hypothetical protein